MELGVDTKLLRQYFVHTSCSAFIDAFSSTRFYSWLCRSKENNPYKKEIESFSIDLSAFKQTMAPSRGSSGQKYSKCMKMYTRALWFYCSYALKWNAEKVYCYFKIVESLSIFFTVSFLTDILFLFARFNV